MAKKIFPQDAIDINDEMNEEDFWNVGFTYNLLKVKTPEVKEAMKGFRRASKNLAKVVGYPL